MAAEQYIILLHNNEWKISFKEKYYGPYDTGRAAIEADIDAAYAMGEIGIDAQVKVQIQTSNFELNGITVKTLLPLGDKKSRRKTLSNDSHLAPPE